MDFTITSNKVSQEVTALLAKIKRTDEGTAEKIQKLEDDVKNLKDLIQFSFKPLIEATNKELMETKQVLSEMQKNEMKLEEILRAIQNDNEKLKLSLARQCSFSVSLGATMGSLFWRSTGVPQVVNLIIETGKVDEFLSLAGATVGIFVCSLDKFSSSPSEEVQFISSIFGIIANLANSDRGLRKLTSKTPNKEILAKILLLLPKIYEKAEEDLKKIIFLLLNSVCSFSDGLILVRRIGKPLFLMISSAMQQNTSSQLQIASLLVLKTISQNRDDLIFYQMLIQMIPKTVLESWKQGEQAHVKYHLTNIIKCYEVFETSIQSDVLKY